MSGVWEGIGCGWQIEHKKKNGMGVQCTMGLHINMYIFLKIDLKRARASSMG